MLRSRFTEHPASVGETYTGHMATAGRFGLGMLAGAAVCLVHAVFPFLFERTGSRIVADLHDRMVAHRVRRPDPSPRGAVPSPAAETRVSAHPSA